MNLRVKLVALLTIMAFSWAFVQTGTLEEREAATGHSRDHRVRPPSQKASALQIEVIGAKSEYRLVKHPLGTTQVPLSPRRIVSLSSAATDSLVALGVRPILVESPTRDDGPPTHLTESLKGISLLRGGGLLSLEAVAAVRPDLIFIGSGPNRRLYEQFRKIAPTIPIGSSLRGDRECRILEVGEVLGMAQQSRERLAAYRQCVAEARMALALAKHGSVAFLRFRRSTCVIYTQTAMFGPLLFEQLGLTPDPAMPVGAASRGWDVLSVERLASLGAEHVFMVVDKDSEHYLDGIARTPIWRNLPAVMRGHVHRVNSGTWIGSDGLLGCEAIVRDVLTAMVTGDHR